MVRGTFPILLWATALAPGRDPVLTLSEVDNVIINPLL
jgi:hypothetical protein